MSIDLLSMTATDLEKLRSDVDVALKTVKDRERKEAIRAAEAAAAEYGFTLAEITGGGAKGRKLNAGIAKYRNPESPDQTWTGKGRQPAWFKAALEAGIDPEKMEI